MSIRWNDDENDEEHRNDFEIDVTNEENGFVTFSIHHWWPGDESAHSWDLHIPKAKIPELISDLRKAV